jgi:hypothetical protein
MLKAQREKVSLMKDYVGASHHPVSEKQSSGPLKEFFEE